MHLDKEIMMVQTNTLPARTLTIAGSDSGGGAGIQADLKTFFSLGTFGMSAITAVTAQNTQGVSGVYPLPIEAVVRQIDDVVSDIGVDAAKTGMLFSAPIVEAVSDRVHVHKLTRLVVDPVMIAKGGAPLLEDSAIEAYMKTLLPRTLIITPNIPEAERLTGIELARDDDRRARARAARMLFEAGTRYVVIKGGHDRGPVVEDLYYDGTRWVVFKKKRQQTAHTHGTGCTFSAAITAFLALGHEPFEAILLAESYIDAAIRSALPLGHGHGPTNHWAYGVKRPEQTLSDAPNPDVTWEEIDP